MTTLLSRLESAKTTTTYQLFEIKSGIDIVNVLVELAKSGEFESALRKTKPTTLAEIIELAEQFGGRKYE